MQHSYIDRYADLDSFIHRVDPRVKIITFFVFILFVVLTSETAYLSFLLYGMVLLILLFSSRIPFLFMFKKSLAVIPFVILIAIFIPFIKKEDGVILFWSILIKSYLSILSMILLTSSAKFSNLLKALEKLKLPRIFIMIISFMYRYSFLLIDQVQRMQRAKESRTFQKKSPMYALKTLSNIVGVLFLRSYERGERVYLAMCSRLFQGEIKTIDTLKIKPSDILFLVFIFSVLFLIQLT